jgi:hypothetical protein
VLGRGAAGIQASGCSRYAAGIGNWEMGYWVLGHSRGAAGNQDSMSTSGSRVCWRMSLKCRSRVSTAQLMMPDFIGREIKREFALHGHDFLHPALTQIFIDDLSHGSRPGFCPGGIEQLVKHIFSMETVALIA